MCQTRSTINLSQAPRYSASATGPGDDAQGEGADALGGVGELATPEWVWWWNHERLHSGLDMRTPAEVAYSAEPEKLPALIR